MNQLEQIEQRDWGRISHNARTGGALVRSAEEWVHQASLDIEYLLRRLKAAEAVIADFDENCEHWAFDQEHFIAWREVAE